MDETKKRGIAVIGLLLGTAIGLVIGFLYEPELSTETLRKIRERLTPGAGKTGI